MCKLRHIKLPAKNRSLLFGNLDAVLTAISRAVPRCDELGARTG